MNRRGAGSFSDMQIGRIVGTVVCTIKNSPLEGKKLLLIQPLDSAGNRRGRVIVGVDAVGAGVGETVYWCRGREASMPWYPEQEVPTETSIVGIVDTITVD
ncbi:MAG: EutN/CcmL family microcompartment protein [Acidobacteriota bacterium]